MYTIDVSTCERSIHRMSGEQRRMKGQKDRRLWIDIPPWLILGIVAVLAPILVYVTIDRIEQHREQTRELLIEKGAALIRSFEAGVRTGMTMKWTSFQIQKLLIETAEQPDIDYLVVVDVRGAILADSDPSLIGEQYGTDLDLPAISRSAKVNWRQVPQSSGADSFEVYREFVPRGTPLSEGAESITATERSPEKRRAGSSSGLVIFVGLDMGPIINSREEDVRHAIWLAVILLLSGFSGITSLLLAQSYRSARTSLSRMKAFSDNLVETMPVGLLVIDGHRKITYCNRAAESILHLASRDILGREAPHVLPQPFIDLIPAISSRTGIMEQQVELPDRDGKAVVLEVVASVLHEDNGTSQGYVILFRDMTEMENLKREMARSQRLASIGSLAAGVAHEIRNPLSSIKGFATYFREHHPDSPSDRETAEIMIREVDRLNRVITQLLELARPVDVNMRPAAINSVIRHTLMVVEGQAREKGIDVRTDLSPKIGELTIDPDRIEQVLLNLYLNAIGAMEKGGTLSVTSSRGSLGMIEIRITDTGAGIEKEDLPRIFDPYFTTKPAGTGLGLALVQRIVEAHGGEVRMESEPGRGTTATVLLPETVAKLLRQQ